MRKTASIVWRFFEKNFENGRATAVTCQLCDCQYKYFGNTTNLKSHLVRKHPIQWELLKSGNLTDVTFNADDESSQLSPKTTAKGFKYVNNEPSDCEADNDDSATAIHIVQDMQRESEEEWLEEDPFHTAIDSYEPKKKKLKVVKIKREVNSPSRRRPSFYTSSKSYDYDAENGLVISDQSYSKDEYTVFGEYVANKLRKFKASRTRGNIQQLITTILWQAEYGAYDNPETVKRVLLLPQNTETKSSTVNEDEAQVNCNKSIQVESETEPS